MHRVQEKILNLSKSQEIGNLKLREIGELVGESHPQKIKHHLNQLIKKGLLTPRGNSSFKIAKPGPIEHTPLIAVPILGSANCGPAACYAEENLQGYLNISKNILKKQRDIFSIQAVGDSMNRTNIGGNSIEDGDYVIVDGSDKDISSNGYFLSISSGLANVKKVINDAPNHRVSLISESSVDYPPIIIHEDDNPDLLIAGKVVQVIKKPKN